jgi:uncharacterized membrane protein
MTLLILGLILFLGIHTVPMAQGLRNSLRTTVSPLMYQVLFALVSLVGLVLIVKGYGQMQGQGRLNPEIYTPPIWLRHITLLLMWPALILLAAAYVPSRIRTKAKHPMLAAIKLWAFSHLLANGDLASLLLFGSFLAWAVFDRISVKRRAALGPLGSKTGGLSGDLIAVAAGTAVYLFLLLWGHQWLIGVSPLAR